MNTFRSNSVLVSAVLLLTSSLGHVWADMDYGSDGLIEVKSINSSEYSTTCNYDKALFGPPYIDEPGENTVGILHEVTPPDACTKVLPPPDVDGILWVALIIRSVKEAKRTCNFIDKVYNAQVAGYITAIVYDYDPNGNLVRMYSENETLENLVEIPSAFVTYSSGMDLCQRSYPNVQDTMSLAMFRPFRDEYIDPYKILIPMAFSFVGILLVAIIIMIVRWCQALRRRRRSRISKSQLRKIPLVKYKKEDQYDCCAICLDDYIEGEKVRLLPCSHTYHKKCIDPWLLKNKRTCPVCKRRVVPRKPRRNRRVDDSSSDSDEFADGGGQNERRPLLPPPHTESSDDGGTGYGAMGHRQQIQGDDIQGSGSSGTTRHPSRGPISTGRRGAARNAVPTTAINSRNLFIDQSTDSSDYSDDGTDLRHPAQLLAQRRTSGPVSAGEHSLRSWPSRPGMDQTYMAPIPPLSNTTSEATQQASSEHNIQPSHDQTVVAMERSPDESVAMERSHDQAEVVIEVPHNDSDDDAQALINSISSQPNNII